MNYRENVKWKLSTAILIVVIVFSLGTIHIRQANAASIKIYSDPQDGWLHSSGSTVHNVESMIMVGDREDNGYDRGFVRFYLGIGFQKISSATLNLYVPLSYHDGVFDVTDPLTNPGLGGCQIIHIADYGTLDPSDFNAPSIGNDPGTIISSSATPNAGYVSIDVRAAMQDDLDHERPYSSFMIKMQTTTDNDNSIDDWYFSTVEATDTAYDPYIAYTAASVGDVASQILSASANNVYFIYADPYRMVAQGADWSAAFAAYDATASGFIYGLCTNTQKIGYDSDPSMVVTKISSGNPSNYGQVLSSSKSIVVMGGPIPNWVVDYYERTGQTPLKFNGVDGFATQTGTTVASLPAGTDMKHNDLFVVEAFTDTNGNSVFIIYGLGWKGTFAGGVYFKEVIAKDLASYTSGAYLYYWTDDSGNDGVPQASEITDALL